MDERREVYDSLKLDHIWDAAGLMPGSAKWLQAMKSGKVSSL
jgi:hypothetical protein